MLCPPIIQVALCYSISFYLYICSWLQTFSSSTSHSHPKSQETQILASYLQVICKTSLSSTHKKMGFRLSGIVRKASFTSSSKAMEVPKGYLAVYVGEKMKRFVIPLSYLNQPSFQDLLSEAEEEFGYDHPMGGLTIPCEENMFLDITSCLS
ncbi:auxin-induced protein 15A-like [Arachis hypogaea]|uniref:auxin-induced protein 15A-like n=1 Tax=Arachis hypogaea TaxID=3818 RepID=UPI000DEC4881|nr:auxin-induced protein 15A-like [Arachis hypogaea]QHN99444.1 Auxin-induced protein [Arachis hypogaea]